jgi:hypothetical protein
MLNQDLFTTYFESLASRFPKTTLTDQAYALYYKLVSADLDDEQFTIAIEKLFRDCEFFPSPKQIIEAAPTMSQLIGRELKRLDLYAELPKDWRDRTGKNYISELPQAQQREYLDHLRNTQPAIAAAKS